LHCGTFDAFSFHDPVGFRRANENGSEANLRQAQERRLLEQQQRILEEQRLLEEQELTPQDGKDANLPENAPAAHSEEEKKETQDSPPETVSGDASGPGVSDVPPSEEEPQTQQESQTGNIPEENESGDQPSRKEAPETAAPAPSEDVRTEPEDALALEDSRN
jgi:hypothetical protein